MIFSRYLNEQLVKFTHSPYYLPKELISFFKKIIDVKKVLNLYSGMGNILLEFDEAVGVEPNRQVAEWSIFLTNKSEKKNKIIIDDPIKWKTEEKFSTIICTQPFGIKDIELFVINKGIELLEGNGTIFIIVPEVFLFGDRNLKVREAISKQINIQAVISLPQSAFQPAASVKTSLLILSKEAAKKTYMASAKSLSDLEYIAGDFQNWYFVGKENTLFFGCEATLDNTRWDFSFYEPIDFEIGEVDFKYDIVKLSDICNIGFGKLSKDSKIAINKTGSKIIWLADGDKLIEKNNFFLTPEKNINPYYLLLFLNSSLGQKSLAKIIKGAVIPYISQKDIQKMPIVLPNQVTQNNIVEEAIEIRKILAAIESLNIEGKNALSDKLFRLKEIKEKYKTFSKATEEAFYQTLPFPIAVTYRKMSNAPNNTQRFSLMIELFESVVRFIVLVNLADYINKQKQAETIVHDIPDIGKLCIPSLGDWIKLFSSLFQIKSLPDSQPFIAEFKGLKLDKYNKVLEEFVRIRNDSIRGHGATISEQEYGIKFQEYFPKLEELIRSLSFLGNYRLIQATSMTKEGEFFKISIKKLVGDNMLFPTYILDARNPLDTNKVIYLNKNGESLILEPFITLAACPECKRDELLLFDKFNESKITYLSYECGHRPSLANVNNLPQVIRHLAIRRH